MKNLELRNIYMAHDNSSFFIFLYIFATHCLI